jgi:glycosyltransferase involved in cell wall biosynthesis
MNSNPDADQNSLRVLQLNSLLTGGGTDDQCVKLASGLARLGVKVAIAGPEGREWSSRIKALHVPFFDTGAHASKLQFILRAARAARREKIQIIHGHHGRDIWPTILAARLSGVRPKIVLTRHMAKSPASWASRHFLLGQCDILIAVSEFVARVLREGVNEPDSPEEERRFRPPIFGDHRKIRVINGGIDVNRFQPADASEKRRELGLTPEHFAFAVVGGYDLPRGKGQREFLRAAAAVHEKIPDARFLIIGRGTMSEILQQDIARLGLTGKAWLPPYAADMPQVMNAIDCLVHPQIGTEAFPLVISEAHACGKSIIASALDGIPEAFSAAAHGELVPPEDIAALSSALLRQATQPPLTLSQKRELHAKVAQKLSLDHLATAHLHLYRSLLV